MRPRPARLLLLVLPVLALAGCYAPYDPGYPPGGEVYGVAPAPDYGPYYGPSYAPAAPYYYPPAYGFGFSYSYVDIDRHGHGKRKHHYGYKDKHKYKDKRHYGGGGHGKPYHGRPKGGGRTHAAVPYKDPRGPSTSAPRRPSRNFAAPQHEHKSGVTRPSQRIVPSDRSAARGYTVRNSPSARTRYNYGKPGGRGG